MTNTITKEQAVQLAISTGMLSDGFCVTDRDATTVHVLAQAAYKLGRNAGLEEAATWHALTGWMLDESDVPEKIRSLKDNT